MSKEKMMSPEELEKEVKDTLRPHLTKEQMKKFDEMLEERKREFYEEHKKELDDLVEQDIKEDNKQRYADMKYFLRN